MYGFPNNPGRHVQDAALFCSLQTAFIPQGEGLHGSIISGVGLVLIGFLHSEKGSPE
jgi:hypothetical protein